MPNNDDKEALLKEIEDAVETYRKLKITMASVQWVVLLSVAIAGFFTTAAGSVEASSKAWFATNSLLVIWGLIAAIGSIIVQNAKPAYWAERFERKRDAMRALRTALKYRNLELVVAAELFEVARSEPAQALAVLSKKQSEDTAPLEEGDSVAH